jgi:hypothetical protein
VLPLAELDRHWRGREYPATAYEARIELYGPPPRLAPDRTDSVFVRVTNLGTETFPGLPEDDPAIRLSYRWLDGDGSPLVSEGVRTAFSAPVPAGRTIVAPVTVVAPGPGRYVLEVDLVHEHIRWFGSKLRIPVEVTDAAPGLPPVGPRLRETPPPRLARWRRQRIPRLMHRVWLGGQEMPRAFREYGESWRLHHRGWEMRLWTDADLRDLGLEDLAAQAPSATELSNAVRYEVLRRYGGVYADADVECRRPIEPLLRGIDAFAALENSGCIGTGVLGCVPGHAAFVRAAAEFRNTIGIGAHSADADGPYFLTLLLEDEPGVAIFGAHMFRPFAGTNRSGDRTRTRIPTESTTSAGP